jgi:HD-like signal output (HDOD) protein
MMFTAGVLIGVLLCLGAWFLRRRKPAPPAPPAPSAAPAGTAPVLDVASIAAANSMLEQRLWRLAFGAPSQANIEDPAQPAIREAIFRLLRADALDPKYFPRRPTLMPQLLRAFDDPRAASDQISRMIAHDPVLTADVLRLANSSLYRTSPTPIETIQRAVVVCGVEELRGLLATAMLQPVFRATRQNFPRFPRLLWERTERAARAAELYAARTNPEDRFEAQMVALMSALGPLVVYGAALELYARTPQIVPNPQLCATLIHDLGPLMSQRVAKQWETAPRLVAALKKSADESLTTALTVGELLGTLSVLESQTLISRAERLEATRSAGLPDELVNDIWVRPAGNV